jgi:hypothetical protein
MNLGQHRGQLLLRREAIDLFQVGIDGRGAKLSMADSFMQAAK